MTKKIVILFSGEGSNFENIVNKLHNKEFDGNKIIVSGAICNKSEANGLIRAKKLKIPVVLIDHKKFSTREEFDKTVVDTITTFGCDLAVLAGFMRILTPVFTKNIKAINIHPSFLPYCKGSNGIKDSYYSDIGFGGVSVHWVNDGVDDGAIIDQKKVLIDKGETLEYFEAKIHAIEYEIYPSAILKALKIDI